MTNPTILAHKLADRLPTFHISITLASVTVELYSFKKNYDGSLYRCTGVLTKFTSHVRRFEKFMLGWDETAVHKYLGAR
jgi:hypothetical protein